MLSSPFKKVMLVGDSLTYGSGSLPGTSINGGYRVPLYNLLLSSFITPIFVGNSCHNSPVPIVPHGDASTYHSGFANYSICKIKNTLIEHPTLYGLGGIVALPEEVNLIVLMAGITDILSGTPPVTAVSDLIGLVQLLKRNYTNARIIIIPIPILFMSYYINQSELIDRALFNEMLMTSDLLIHDDRITILTEMNDVAYGTIDGRYPSNVYGYNTIAKIIHGCIMKNQLL